MRVSALAKPGSSNAAIVPCSLVMCDRRSNGNGHGGSTFMRAESRAADRPAGRQAFIDLDGLPVLEQHLIRAAAGRIPHEHQYAGGHAVQSVRWRDVRLPQPLTQSDQRGLPIPHAAWHGGQKMRLVHHDDPLVLIQHVHLKRNMRLVNHIPMWLTQRSRTWRGCGACPRRSP